MEFDKSIANSHYASAFPAPPTGETAAHIRGALTHKLRNRQRLSLPSKPCDSAFVVADGVAIIEVTYSTGQPNIAGVLFPGDTVIPAALPPVSKPAIACVSRHGVVVQRGVSLKPAAERQGTAILADLDSEMTFNAARAMLHGLVVANLTSEERVATILTEFALRLGKPTSEGCIFEMPLSRTDIAVFLGLNPDTVSRIMSALRAAGIIRTVGRGSIICASLEKLMARSPVSDLLRQMLATRRPTLL